MTGGYLYAMWNPVYETYGDNVYKLGKTQNLPQRKSSYTTSYIDESIYKYTSDYFDDMHAAEQMLFVLLKKYRIKNKREFFKCDLNIIISQIKRVKSILDDEINTTEKQKPASQTTVTDVNETERQQSIISQTDNKTVVFSPKDEEEIHNSPKMQTSENAENQPIKKKIQKNALIHNQVEKLVHKNKVMPYGINPKTQCPDCLKNFSSSQRLKSHINRKSHCSQQKLYPVYPFINNEDVIKIIIKQDSTKEQKKYICQYCYVSFTRKSNLIRHQKNICHNQTNSENQVNDQINKELLRFLQHSTRKIETLEKQINELKHEK